MDSNSCRASLEPRLKNTRPIRVISLLSRQDKSHSTVSYMQMRSSGRRWAKSPERTLAKAAGADCLLAAKHVANLIQRKLLAQVHRWQADVYDGGHTHFIQQCDGRADIFWSRLSAELDQKWIYALRTLDEKIGRGGASFLCRLCDDTEDMQDKVSVIQQRQQEYQLKSSMFMNKSPQESPGEQTLQKCIAENRACVCQQSLGISPQPNETINNVHCCTRSRGKQLIEAIQS